MYQDLITKFYFPHKLLLNLSLLFVSSTQYPDITVTLLLEIVAKEDL